MQGGGRERKGEGREVCMVWLSWLNCPLFFGLVGVDVFEVPPTGSRGEENTFVAI